MESNPTVVQELRSAAEACLNRGFAILICKPHDKDPWPEYSPHAVNSAILATTDEKKDLALKPWTDGHEANFGVAGGKSNLAIIDVDQGIKDDAGLYEWMQKRGLPETFIVRSGRKGEYAGYHLYYQSNVPTTTYEFDGVIGEVRSIGAYVVGPGCYHPSGDRYRIIKDVPVVSLPDEWRNLCLAKTKSKEDFQNDGELIPEGHRWAHLQKQAGVFKNAGITDEELLYQCLRSFAITHCVDGASYPEEKIRQLAAWAGSDLCDVMKPTGVVTFGKPDPEPEERNLETPEESIGGDFLGDLSEAITNGTFIPAGYARASLKTILGCVLDGKIIPQKWEGKFTMRHWTGIISENPEAGKTQIWKRLREIAQLQHRVLDHNDVKQPSDGLFSSGEHIIKVLAENDGKPHLVYCDEMKALFDKAGAQGASIFTRLLPLYEDTAASVGSITHTTHEFKNVSLSMQGNFIRKAFEKSLAGKGAAGSGFLSRMVLEYSAGKDHDGDWDMIDPEKLNSAVAGIEAALQKINEWVNGGIVNDVAQNPNKNPFNINETDEAKELRQEFQTWLKGKRKKTIKDDDIDTTSRLDAHFRRDLLFRAVFSHAADMTVTKEMVERSIEWAKHQLRIRETLYPIDEGNDVERFEKSILKTIERKGPMTKQGIIKFTNPDKVQGGFEAWNRAWKALLFADHVVLIPELKYRGVDKFGLAGRIWQMKGDEGRWIRNFDA